MIDLLSEAAGGRVVACNDEFFAEAVNLIRNDDPVWRDGVYTDSGKWMDGWETRRRREPGHDWCVMALGIPGRVERVTVDTSHFTGNYPEEFSLSACGVGAGKSIDSADWSELVARTALRGDSVASFDVDDSHRVTHLRLNIYPDGGVARLRVYGQAIPAMDLVCPDRSVDLVSSLVGGEAFDASDKHYSDPSNLLRPTPSAGMWDGWETRRRRGPGHDWAVFRLGLSGRSERVVIDTTHFKGNAPGWVSLDVSADGHIWNPALERVPVKADALNEIEIPDPRDADFVRLSIHPDGGMARFKLLGTVGSERAAEAVIEYVNSLFDSEARGFFEACCHSSAWVAEMTRARPYSSPEEVLERADEVFDSLTDEDWLEAFAGHPRIGERGDPEANREQAATRSASREVIARLAAVNAEYEDKFGFTYIVYATGKTAEQMLEIAEARLSGTRPGEIANASKEQRAITATRLRRMMCMDTK